MKIKLEFTDNNVQDVKYFKKSIYSNSAITCIGTEINLLQT